MKIAITIVAALLVAGCATDPARHAAWNARDQNCRDIWVYKQAEFVCRSFVRESGSLQTLFDKPVSKYSYLKPYGENTRNTPRENARIDQGLAQFGKGKN